MPDRRGRKSVYNIKGTYSLYSTGLLPRNRFMHSFPIPGLKDGEISLYTGLLEPSGDSVSPTSETDRYWHWYSGKFDLIETSFQFQFLYYFSLSRSIPAVIQGVRAVQSPELFINLTLRRVSYA